jgi:hypothetical protein
MFICGLFNGAWVGNEWPMGNNVSESISRDVVENVRNSTDNFLEEGSANSHSFAAGLAFPASD